MKVLWAPWRIEYILGPKPDECVFCLPPGRDEDAERLVLCRGRHTFVIMNKYPYNNGHLLVVPYRHLATISQLSPEESLEFMGLLQKSGELLQRHMKMQGLNIGINQGEASGAGIREHLHAHLVPRWNGDSSFMAVMSEVRSIPQHLRSTYEALRPYFAELIF